VTENMGGEEAEDSDVMRMGSHHALSMVRDTETCFAMPRHVTLVWTVRSFDSGEAKRVGTEEDNVGGEAADEELEAEGWDWSLGRPVGTLETT